MLLSVAFAAVALRGLARLNLVPAPQSLPGELVEEGHAIPVARVQAMHEGKRRKRSRGE